MRTTACFAIACFAASTLCQNAFAAPVPYWFDGFDTSGPTSDINADIAAGRQGGAPVPVSYVANTANPANDFHHQMFGTPNILQLAGDFTLPNPGDRTLVSPNFDFSGVVGDQAIGRKVQVSMDAFFNSSAAPGSFSQAAITIGASAPLADSNLKADGLSVVFVEDQFNGNGNFIQVFDGNTIVGNLIPNPAGQFGGFVEIFLDDPTDGDPFNGVGTTEVGVLVNSTPIFNFSKGGGGYTSNYITLEGGPQTNFALNALALHSFDNLTVFTDTVIPEPTSLLLLSCTMAGFALRGRR